MFEIHAGLVAGGTILFSRHIGMQTPRSVMAEIAKLSCLYKEHPTVDEIVDMSQVTGSELDFRSVSAVGTNTSRNARPAEGGIKKIGIFAPSDVMYGLCRIHSTVLEIKNAGVESAVFRTEADVLAYLGRSEPRFADLPGHDDVGPLPPLGSAACT